MCTEQTTMCSQSRFDHWKRDKQTSRFPNFLIDTILNKFPHDVAAPSSVSTSASTLLGRQGYALQREQAILAYAQHLTKWRVWIQSKREQHATLSPFDNFQREAKATENHEEKQPTLKVWNPVDLNVGHLAEEESVVEDDENHINKLRQMSKVLAKKENKAAGGRKVENTQASATSDVRNLQNEKELNHNEEMEAKSQALWPAWVYCTRYSNRPSAGPRTRKHKRKNRMSKQDGGDDKRARTVFSPQQLDELQREFNESQYLTEERRVRLSNNLGLTVAQIKIWFQNKRAKVKKNSGVQNVLAMQLKAQGLYDHSTQSPTHSEKVRGDLF